MPNTIVEAGVDAFRYVATQCETPCEVDLNGDGTLDFFDVSEFLALFGICDLAADLNGDGILVFFDTSAFLAHFAAGCP